jgi:hypothetical protein
MVKELKNFDERKVTAESDTQVAFGFKNGRHPNAFLRDSGAYSMGGAKPLEAPAVGYYDVPDKVYENQVSKRSTG